MRGREPRQRAVAPVVGEAALVQETFVGEGVHRHELHRRDAQRLQVLDHGRHGQREILAPPLRRYVRMQLREALHVQLVDQRIAPRHCGLPVAFPVEDAVDDAAAWHGGGAVDEAGPEAFRVRRVVTQHARMPLRLADDVARPGIQQQLVRIEAISLARIVGTVHADAIQSAHARQLALDEAVMHGTGPARQREARGLTRAGRVVQAHVHARGGARADREVDAFAGPGRAQGFGRPCLHVVRLRNTAARGGNLMRSA